MKERIKKLIEQAELPLFDINGNCKYNDTYFDKEKFAELIVKECIQVAMHADNDDKEYAWFAIQRHFGVEE